MGKVIEDGDLCESVVYDEVWMQQSENEVKIVEIEVQFEWVQIMKDEEIDISVVGVGVCVIVEDVQNKQCILEIVGSFEVDVFKGKISDVSLMGQVLLGKCFGESVVWLGLKGNVSFKVISVEYF